MQKETNKQNEQDQIRSINNTQEFEQYSVTIICKCKFLYFMLR